jgi:splicing factor 3A subunit 1
MASVPNGTSATKPAAAANAAMEVDSEEPSAKAIGIIQPPPDIKNIVDKTAAFVAKNGPQFEQRILTNEKNTTKFGFLQPHSPYYPYYQKKLQESRLSSGLPAAAAAPAAPKDDKAENKDAAKPEQASEAKKDASATIEAKASVDSMKKRRPLKQPPTDVYTVLPPEGLLIPTLDLDIIKLTAQYVALNGRSFLNGLLTRENRNPQFDFLKGHHYLFGYFTTLVEAYSKVFNPPEGTIERLKKDSDDRVDILERAFQKLDWEAHLEKERQMNEANAAKERETAAMIDWHDFKVIYACVAWFYCWALWDVNAKNWIFAFKFVNPHPRDKSCFLWPFIVLGCS